MNLYFSPFCGVCFHHGSPHKSSHLREQKGMRHATYLLIFRKLWYGLYYYRVMVWDLVGLRAMIGCQIQSVSYVPTSSKGVAGVQFYVFFTIFSCRIAPNCAISVGTAFLWCQRCVRFHTPPPSFPYHTCMSAALILLHGSV